MTWRAAQPEQVLLIFCMIQNLVDGIQMVSKFFGFPLTDEQVQTIASESTFTAMKESSKNTHGGHGSVFFRKGTFS